MRSNSALNLLKASVTGGGIFNHFSGVISLNFYKLAPELASGSILSADAFLLIVLGGACFFSSAFCYILVFLLPPSPPPPAAAGVGPLDAVSGFDLELTGDFELFELFIIFNFFISN